MEHKEKTERLVHLREEYRRGLEFHRVEFSEIERKVKYYLTILIPVFLAIGGYQFREISVAGGHLSAYIGCLLSIIFLAISMFVMSLKTRGIDAGILRPDPPELYGMKYYLDGDSDLWLSFVEEETQEALNAFVKNERENKKKSSWLLRGEVTLFFGVPFAPFVAVILYSFLHACSNEIGFLLSGVPIGVATGVATGIFYWVALIVVVRHRLPVAFF